MCFPDYGNKENFDLQERFKIKKEDFPVYKLFISGRDEPLEYKGDETKADEIKKWVIKETGELFQGFCWLDSDFFLYMQTK